MAERANFLVEIGTEELPPKALAELSAAFHDGVVSRLAEARLAHGGVKAYAAPRRLALRIDALQVAQEDEEKTLTGPPTRVAIVDGQYTKAGLKFAESAGVPVDQLSTVVNERGEYLCARVVARGRPAAEILPGVVEAALAQLPIPKRMRWGSSDAEFVRPVHWLVMLLGADVVPCTLMDTPAGRCTRGHRFHAPQPIELAEAAEYPERLEREGRVQADFGLRRDRIRAQAEAEAAGAGGRLVLDPALLDEVTALVEWPVPVCGRFDERFLELPEEVLIATLQDHQRYFPIRGENGRLLPRFITLSNLESRDPDVVRAGNERVVRPRLADAAFFWSQDRAAPLADRIGALDDVVFQKRLGSVGDKARRVARLARAVAGATGSDADAAERAALLAKCDLITAMVGEFPELQGTMGRYYATADGEAEEICTAVEEHYLPRFAGDRVPGSAAGRAVAIADKLDTIAGIFAIGQKPTGNKDPFGIRRAALGTLRILVECGLDLDLEALVRDALAAQPVPATDGMAEEILDYLMDRLKGYYAEGGAGLRAGHDAFTAVLARRPVSMVDFHERLKAVVDFSGLEAAAALAAANKRIANILRQAGEDEVRASHAQMLREPAERALHEAVESMSEVVDPLVTRRAYREALEKLAGLRPVVDTFFDEVLVMDPDEAVRRNRLALLARLRGLFMGIADVSRLGD
jgi:glycyl-tRNA synthetase beta chain